MPHPKTLIFTTGETPQVVTETLWALGHRDPPWLPDRILLATTARGAEVYRNGRSDARGVLPPLLGAGGRLAELWRQLAPGRPLPEPEVLVPEGPHGPIEDLRTEAEVEAFAETLLKAVAGVTAGQEGELHLSLAGGRKTMSFLAGQVLSLLARPQDVLSHVLIEPASLEFRPDFWWPGDGSPGSEDAQVRLHQVPFLRARAFADPDRLISPDRGFGRSVEKANQFLSDATLLDLVQQTVLVGGEIIRLHPREAAVLGLVLVARRRRVTLERVVPPVAKNEAPDPRVAFGTDIPAALTLWAWLVGAASLDRIKVHEEQAGVALGFDEWTRKARAKFAYQSDFQQPLSRVRRKLGKVLPARLAERVVSPDGPSSLLDPSFIRIVCAAALASHPDRPPEVEAAPD